MKVHMSKVWMVTVLVVIVTAFGLNKTVVAQQGPADFEQGVEVLTRGPVHEAFAGTVTFNPEAGVVVPKAVPDGIEEVPPEQRPEGADVAWIPGYWAWDDEGGDFLWVSGIWRALPPGRQWVPGYWGSSRQGAQWTSGYWADATVSAVQYLPAPPATLEVGPNIAPPAPDQSWVPGCWVWYDRHYAWRPGYWETMHPDWNWVPDHYVWAPRGYVFVDGYWDYSVRRRGVLFAPVHFDTGVYTRRGFSYSPTTVIDLAAFSDHLFLRPRYQHYYFGDYYAPTYRSGGFYAAFSFNSSRHGYDPIYAHQRWEHRQDRDWEHRVQSDFQSRRDHEDARPPRTLAIQTRLSTNTVGSHARSRVVATPFNQMASRKDSPIRLQPVAKEERQQIAQRGHEVQAFRTTRHKLEINPGQPSITDASRQAEPARVSLPRSPIVARSAAQLGKDQAPPKRHEAPKSDPRVTRTRTPSAEPKDKGKGKDK